jgi:hypothetical protein
VSRVDAAFVAFLIVGILRPFVHGFLFAFLDDVFPVRR